MVGQTLGRYRIIEELGAGGMGVVYRALDDRLNRDVAVKVLAATAFEDPEARARFRHEAMALARLSHPNIASVYDFDTTDGLDLLVMEFVPGATLSDKIKSGPLPEKAVLELGKQLTQGLTAAHDAGIVHRDLKPGNIRITPDGRLKILDFGLAKELRPGTTATVTKIATGQGQILGTLPYMAPEQLRGWPIDARTDIHAAGAVLYEMVTGRRPFIGQSDLLVADLILNHPAVPPRSLNATVSPALDQVIVKALEKDPEHRYQSAAEVRVDLDRIALARLQPPSGAGSDRIQTATRSKRRRWVLGLSAGSVAIIGGTLLLILMANRPALSFASRDWILLTRVENMTGDPVFDNSLDTAFRVSLEQSMYANVFSASRVAAALKRMGKAGLEAVDVPVGREICQRESIRGLVSPTISQVGRMYAITTRLIDPATGDTVRSYVEQADSKDHVLVAVTNVAARLRRDLGESLQSIQRTSMPLPQATTGSLDALKAFAEALALQRKNDFQGAAQLFESALQFDPDFALAHSDLGLAYGTFIFNDRVRAREHLERAMALRNRVTERERLAVELSYHTSLGHRDEAAVIYELYLSKWPDDAGQRFNFGTTLRDAGRIDEAIEQFQQAVRIAPKDAGSLVNLATCYVTQGRFNDAAASWERALAIEPTWITSGNLNNEYGFTLVANGNPARAREVFDLAIKDKALHAIGLRSAALLDMYQGKYRGAEAKLAEAVIANKATGALLSEARNHLFAALVLAGRGDRTGALNALAASYRLRDPKSPQPWLWARVGATYASLGALPAADAILTVVRAEAAADRAEDRATLHWLEGEIQLAKGQAKPALEKLQVAEKEAGATLSALVLDALARAYRDAGNPVQAMATYEALAHQFCLGWEAQPGWVAGKYELAKLYAAAKQPDKARTQLDALLELWQNADAELPLLKKAKDLRGRVGG